MTFTARAVDNTIVGDDSTGERRQIGGDLATRLAYANRYGSSSKRAELEFGDGVISTIGVNRRADGPINGCDDSHQPDPKRPHYCGVITDVNASTGVVTLDARLSYPDQDNLNSREEIAVINVPASNATVVLDWGRPEQTVTGNLAARLAYAKREGSGTGRAHLKITDGKLEQIEVNRFAGDQVVDGCPAG